VKMMCLCSLRMAVRVRITRISAKLRQLRSMNMTQQLAVLFLTRTKARVLGSNHTPRSNSPASMHPGSSPGTSQGKASMDIERNTRPVRDKFGRSASRELFPTSPSRRMASIPIPLPSHLDMDRPVSSTSPGGSDLYASIASFQASARSTESVTCSSPFSSSSRAATIAAAAHSTPQSTSEHQPPAALSHPTSLTPRFLPTRTTTSRPAPTPFPTKFTIDGVPARLSPAIITRQPQHPILSLPPISATSTPANDFRRLRPGSLRSVPALPMEGSDDRGPAEHDNADLDDLDEEDEVMVDVDEPSEEESPEAELPDTSSEDGESSSGPHSSEASRPGNLPVIAVSPLDLSFLSGPSLRQRLSMPTFGPSTELPTYSAFRSGEAGSTIQIKPRDEEGYEHLPHYTNDIYLRAIMPRKMEFAAPGVEARDRKWRRTLCILEGTAFRVYRCPPTASGKGLIGNLWEKTVGVGDVVTQSTQMGSSTAKMKEKESVREVRRTKFDGVDSPLVQPPASSPSASGPSQPSSDSDLEDQPLPSSTRSRLLPSNFRRKNRAASGDPSTSRLFSPPHQTALKSISGQGFVKPPTPRTESALAMPGLGGASSAPTPRTPLGARRHLWVDDPAVPLPREQDLLQTYSLQNAESGLGSDYLKRRNVIRIRAEGQQFLLQARDVASVVDWIEVRPLAHWAVNG
jgi:hypothetical protein